MSLGRRALFGALTALCMAPVAATAATAPEQTPDELVEEIRDGLSLLLQPYLFEEVTPTLLADLQADVMRFLSTKRLADHVCACAWRNNALMVDIVFRQPGREWRYMPVRISG